MAESDTHPGTEQPTDRRRSQRVTVADAAVLLGISEDAVRSRLKRGMLRRETGNDGTVFVVLDADRPSTDQRPMNDRQADQTSTDHSPSGASEVVEVLRDEVSHLRDQLDHEREASSELRRIIAALTARIPELEAPRETRDGPETASPRSSRDTRLPRTLRSP